MRKSRKNLPQIKLLILLAKVQLSDVEKADANLLLSEISDWHGFLRSAGLNFCLPLVRRHLADLKQDLVPEIARKAAHKEANGIVARNLMIAAVQNRFLEKCLNPIGVTGIFFKGITIAAQYYPDIGLRPCRDIDVLVPFGSMRSVLRRAIEQGYKIIAPRAQSRELTSERDINAVLRFGKSAALISPEGMIIDLQTTIDKNSGIFEGVDLFDDYETVQIAGKQFPTMRTAFLFNYLCHHHARHTWSHLHWLSDLDAIISSKSFNREETLHLASQLGQTGTVEASLELHELMSSQSEWDDGEKLQRGKAFLQLCLSNLPGGLDLEKRMSLKLIGGEFMFPWQARADLLAKARKRWWRSIMQPTLVQYADHPLPEILQWVYYVPRCLYLIEHTLRRRNFPQ